MCVKGENEIYCWGAHVRISEKSIEVLSEPMVEHFPLHRALYGTTLIDVETACKTAEMNIADFGLFNRVWQ
jgi:hypothetical protein